MTDTFVVAPTFDAPAGSCFVLQTEWPEPPFVETFTIGYDVTDLPLIVPR